MLLTILLIITVLNLFGIVYLVYKVADFEYKFKISDGNFDKIIKLMKMYRDKERNRNKINLN